MNNERREREVQSFRKHIRHNKIYGLYKVMTLQACAFASRCEALYRLPLDELRESILEWADEDLKLLGPLPPLEQPKERLFLAFADLAASQARFSFEVKEPSHCPVCGSRLVIAYTEPLVCERCMQPVLEALDDLVRATTKEWTPQSLRESYLEALNSASETDDE